MKVLFYRKTGKVLAEELNRSVTFMEQEDGLHPVPATSIFKDEKGILPPICLIYDDIVAPESKTKQDEAYMNEILGRIDVIKQNGKTLNVSRLFWRRLAAFVKKNAFWILLAGGVLVTVAVAFMLDPNLVADIMAQFNHANGPVIDSGVDTNNTVTNPPPTNTTTEAPNPDDYVYQLVREW